MPARFEIGAGAIDFPFGTARLAVDGETLTIDAAAADEAALARVEAVVASHLLRFAFREELKLEWQRG